MVSPIGPVAFVDVEFRDRDDNVAQSRLYMPFSASPDDGLALALQFIARAAGVSNAQATRIAVSYKFILEQPSPPEETSNVGQLSIWLYQNFDEEINAITIPSPLFSIFEQAGSYAGMRIDMLNPAVLYFGDITASFLVTRDGRNLGALVTGGLML